MVHCKLTATVQNLGEAYESSTHVREVLREQQEGQWAGQLALGSVADGPM